MSNCFIYFEAYLEEMFAAGQTQSFKKTCPTAKPEHIYVLGPWNTQSSSCLLDLIEKHL